MRIVLNMDDLVMVEVSDFYAPKGEWQVVSPQYCPICGGGEFLTIGTFDGSWVCANEDCRNSWLIVLIKRRGS